MLNSNANALNFYGKLGAKVIDPIKVCRLEGEALAQLVNITI